MAPRGRVAAPANLGLTFLQPVPEGACVGRSERQQGYGRPAFCAGPRLLRRRQKKSRLQTQLHRQPHECIMSYLNLTRRE